MPVLTMYNRPQVKFDVNNPEHRKWLAEFTVTQSWRHCPVRLVLPGAGNIIAMMQNKLLQYYIEKEMGIKA